ncbi:MAG: hypothetical protein M4579_001934 [Chaenotheca gracillima]|nr:MAG: hypothetical protein M4579_001934 [Chaenotheca gracillima]
MSNDPKDQKPSIPQWQRQLVQEPSAKDSTSESSEGAEAPPTSRADLIAQASRFLEEDDIRNAPNERKVTFLESKGLTQEEIGGVLATASKTDTVANPKSDALVPPTETATPPSKSDLAAPSSLSISSRDTPPIITYPEFLTRSSSSMAPPPLVTGSRILNAIYLSTGVFATAYGASQYLVKPMVESLTMARHSLANTTISNLSELNTKLENTVSEIPQSALPPRFHGDVDTESNAPSTVDSDPTELFHVDIGTQTSPDLSRRGSASSTPPRGNAPPNKDEQLASQEKRLKGISAHLADILEDNYDVGFADDATMSSMADLRGYLEGLAYSSPYYAATGGYGGIIGGGNNGGGADSNTGRPGSSSARGKDEDVIAQMKKEIRGVKGVLLSARNFPGSGGVGKARAY